MNRGLT